MTIPVKPADAFRLVVWNANGGVHRKMTHLARLQPDVAIVPECADVATIRRKLPAGTPAYSQLWVGSNPNKGLTVFGFGDTGITLGNDYNPLLQWVAPIAVHGRLPFTLLAVWAFYDRAAEFHQAEPRMSQPQQLLTVYNRCFAATPPVVAGDFNNNVFWDRGDRPINWRRTVTAYHDAGLASVYHAERAVAQGSEPEPTLYWQTRAEHGRTYHIDYCFIPRSWLPAVCSVSLGAYADWVGWGLSDHVPLVVDLDITRLPAHTLPALAI